jgi:hypothetical protein
MHFFRDESISTLPDVNVSNLLILCLLEQLCPFIEKDPAKAQRLNDSNNIFGFLAEKKWLMFSILIIFSVLVVQLQALELIDVVSPSEDFKSMRNEYKESLFRLVTHAQRVVSQEPDTKALVPK